MVVGKIVYFVLPGTTEICKGRIIKKEAFNGNKTNFFIQNLDQVGVIVLSLEEVFDTDKEAKLHAKERIREEYISIVEGFSPKELLEYLVSLHPIRNDVDVDVRNVIQVLIEKYFKINLE
ncbi:hypothetical protein [Aneurinibacillus aneurinilyticus]|uniref:Uncharacterized protein n=1 Tax=Aneurinibacillus aneurinilyticus ATCC 12856 TaxID=649747 RepID=U1WSL6_ANEAE|nr:hypothetical protein [Aneurinibacillus aneurinilyticus]ERI11619.1 hypothetical protein HMPREF0083_00283 [Aneurinibacillus aneurinilyticus ATCC 12856]MED0709759.1 hypothetical protein [Aneurinibacillus aneurinilyticus]MED0726490.1 hypothetical protein [Aneurinibacillus aneurinilyticus]MED0735358.1 hypothetical protein [Aneurinibacillus aneurinilyticus]MED0744258.1 hypothetical protein [Aneurinibacillus aneurinilyticus]